MIFFLFQKKFGKTQKKKGKFDDSDDEEFYLDVDKIEGNQNGNAKEVKKEKDIRDSKVGKKDLDDEKSGKSKVSVKKEQNGFNEKGWLHRLAGKFESLSISFLLIYSSAKRTTRSSN